MKKKSITLTTTSAAETEKFGRLLGTVCVPGTVLALSGDLGSGKTTLTKGIAYGLSNGATVAVTSPSFTLMHVYDTHIPLYHFDLYRLESDDDLEGIGFEEFLYQDGITVIEWAEKAQALLPEHTVFVQLTGVDETTRRVHIRDGNGQLSNALHTHLDRKKTGAITMDSACSK